jgi:hypothetical protein
MKPDQLGPRSQRTIETAATEYMQSSQFRFHLQDFRHLELMDLGPAKPSIPR